eukprot:Colp12_sorted_trinity150504_noHs@6813
MCRFLVYKGKRIQLSQLILKPHNSLIKQAQDASYTPDCPNDPIRNHRLNGDGFGIAWYSLEQQLESCIYKVIEPAWNNKNLRDLSQVISSELIFGHVRAASSGYDVTAENCHPFKYGRFTFMHNGGLSGFCKMKRVMGFVLRDDLYNVIKGTTDSEYCFALFLNALGDPWGDYSAEAIAQAVEGTIQLIIAFQEYFGITVPSSLNFAVTDGRHVVATRFRDDPENDPPSLYYSTGDDFRCDPPNLAVSNAARPRVPSGCAQCQSSPRLGRQISGAVTPNGVSGNCSLYSRHDVCVCGFGIHDRPLNSLVISSAPLTQVKEDWQLLPRNHMIVVEANSSTTHTVESVTVRPVVQGRPSSVELLGRIRRVAESFADLRALVMDSLVSNV